jgi:hypothetical protein
MKTTDDGQIGIAKAPLPYGRAELKIQSTRNVYIGDRCPHS